MDPGAAPTPESTSLEGSALPELTDLDRPRLRPEVPIMWRTATSIQIGDRVIVGSVDRALVAWMTSLDGSSSRHAIVESLTIPETEARRLLRALLTAGALDDAARVATNVRWSTPDGRPAAASRFAATVSTYKDLARSHTAERRRQHTRIGVIGSTPIAQAIVDAILQSGLHHEDESPDLVILADALHPDVPADFDHPAMSGPHLFVSTYAERATVGPLVSPGRTGCLRCRHLHRRDADPSWPVLAVQWSHAIAGLPVVPVDPLLARLAADWAALLVRSWIDLPDDPEVWSDWCLELSLPLGDPQVRDCPPHPLCGCRWTQP